jgi:uncharacterized OB-fold protein
MAITRDDFPLPDVDDPLVAPFFAGATRGELVVTRCTDCLQYVWYPQERCPSCSGALSWVPVSGRGTLFSWAVVRRPFLPAFDEKVPFVSALVAIDEDPAVRIVTNIVGHRGDDDLHAGIPVVATFRPLTFPTVPDKAVIVPMFAPAT